MRLKTTPNSKSETFRDIYKSFSSSRFIDVKNVLWYNTGPRCKKMFLYKTGHSFRRSVAFDLSIVQHDDYRRNEKSNRCENRNLKSNIATSSVETLSAEQICDQEVSFFLKIFVLVLIVLTKIGCGIYKM